MPDIVNPYIAGNPVTGTEMFFGRDDVFTFVQQALTGQHRDNVIVLYGQRRTGKTSVLYQMHRHLDPRYLCVLIDLHGLALKGLSGFVWELANTIVNALRKDYQIELPRLKNRTEFLADARNLFENDFLPQIWAAIGERHVLLMLDEAIRLQEQIQAGELEIEIFEYLRHLMQHHERLNFLFSLGSGLEEMEKEYAFLFSVGLYKKISFLERGAATALITQPVKDCYQVEPAAIDRIMQITSGHAYYTQLVCHSLFNRWQQEQQPQITARAVNAILDEVVERGLAVLKHVWEESTPGEKAVLAGLAAVMGDRNQPIKPQVINRAWQQHAVTLPDSERAKAIQSLIARDVIVGQDKYEFAVELQRIYLLRYERLEWVKEEIAPALREWRATAAPVRALPQKRQKTDATPVRSFLLKPRWLVTVVTVVVTGLCVTSSFIYTQMCGTLGSNLPLCPTNAKPLINVFNATPNQIEKGGPIVLTWDVSNAEKVELIAPAQETLQKSGVKTISIEQSTNFTLKATNFAGSVEKSITVKVTASAATKQAQPTLAADAIDSQPVFEIVNQLRARQGLPVFRSNEQLSGAALSYSLDLARDGTPPDPKRPTTAQETEVVGYEGGRAVELIDMGSDTPDNAVTRWSNDLVSSPLLLSTGFQDAGLGVAHNVTTTYYVLVLGATGVTATPTPAASQLTTSKLGLHISAGNRRGFSDLLQKIANTGKHLALVVEVNQDVGPDLQRYGNSQSLVVGRTQVDIRHEPIDDCIYPQGTGVTQTLEARQAAQAYFDRVKPVWDANSSIKIWQPLNECDGSYDFQSDFYLALMKLAEGEGVHLALYGSSAGNPRDLASARQMIPALQYAKKHGHYLALHEYGFGSPELRDAQGNLIAPAGSLRASAPNLALRYRSLYENVLIPNDADAPLLLTEVGPGVGGFPPLSLTDWLADLRWYDSELMKDKYVVGAAVYQLGGAENIVSALPVLGDYIADPTAPIQIPTSTPIPTPTATLTPIPTRVPATPATPTASSRATPIAIASQAVNLLQYAPSATWTNGSGDTGLWMNFYPDQQLPGTERGYAAYVTGRILEATGEVGNRIVVATHPQFMPNGEIRGSFSITLPPRGADFFATLEFVKGAAGPNVDGVHVDVKWCDAKRGAAPCAAIAQTDASDNGQATNLRDRKSVV
jgi:uncharacterized protein YkwD